MKKYRSKISYGLLVVICIAILLPFIIDVSYGELSEVNWARRSILFLLLGTILYFFFTIVYIIDANVLKVKWGPFSYKLIKIESIRAVHKSRDIISSPAASFDRISVKYGTFNEIILSPNDKKIFVQHLQEINPNIKTDII